MKKLLLVLFLATSLFQLSITGINATGGTFDCKFMAQYGCRVFSDHCTTDYGTDINTCLNLNSTDCNKKTNNPCVLGSTQHVTNMAAEIPQQGSCAAESIDTAIGCIPVGNLSSFSGFLLGWGVGIGGGIAFILIVISGFMIMTASGNPERLQAGKELMTSAIMGLIMLIFSVFILKIIGVDILQLPGIT